MMHFSTFQQMDDPQQRQLDREHANLKRLKETFDWKTSNAKIVLDKYFEGKYNYQNALSLAKQLASMMNIKLTHEEHRREIFLQNWFDRNLDQIQTLLNPNPLSSFQFNEFVEFIE
jgi:hypothetical protein